MISLIITCCLSASFIIRVCEVVVDQELMTFQSCLIAMIGLRSLRTSSSLIIQAWYWSCLYLRIAQVMLLSI